MICWISSASKAHIENIYLLACCVVKGSENCVARAKTSFRTDLERNEFYIRIYSNNSRFIYIRSDSSCYMGSMSLVIPSIIVIVYEVFSYFFIGRIFEVRMSIIYSGIYDSDSNLLGSLFLGCYIAVALVGFYSPCFCEVFSV